MKTEMTLAVTTKELWELVNYEKDAVIKIQDADIMDKILSHGIFEHRNLLEDDPNFKQIIPYAVISCRNMVYVFHRLDKQTEKRLHNLYSLGVGGHMNPNGMVLNTAYLHSQLQREMNEEVNVHDDCKIESLTPIGFINDDTNEVGKVHLGILYRIELSNTNIEIREREKMTGKWVHKNQLCDFYPQMETWSQLYCSLVGIK